MNLVLAALACALCASSAPAQGCVFPVVPAIGSTSFSTAGGVPGFGCGFGHNYVGFRWTAPWSGAFVMSTCGGDGTDTLLGVRAPCGVGGQVIGCSDDVCGVESMVQIDAQAGVEYEIDVGTFWFGGDIVNGLLEVFPVPVAGTSFCYGDGSGTACPCGNAGATGRGCANHVEARGGLLVASGTPSVAADSLILGATGLPNATALFFQGDARVANGAGAAFGDGLRCVAGSVVRLEAVAVLGATARHPQPGGTPISVRGPVVAGDVRYYQAWYRDPPAYCTSATFNYTNARRIAWTS